MKRNLMEFIEEETVIYLYLKCV